MGRFLGVDFGSRRIGLALSDTRGLIASPAGLLRASGDPGQDARLVLARAAESGATGIVVGLPVNMDGSEGPQAHAARRFAELLCGAGTVPVELWDERLTSFQADEHLAAAELSRSARKRRRDAIAAQVMLQSFLDARRDRRTADPNPDGPG
jgi:putative Holliday junction resolvase